jgi:uncharacterized Ntn-hydrolase superfamily protein
MTFTVLARDPETGRLGIGLATYSLAVGGYCPFIRARVGAVTTQAFAEPRLGPLALRLLAMGYAPPKVLLELGSSDPGWAYRQVGIVDRDGAASVHTGEKTRPYAGHLVEEGVITCGNFLAGPPTVAAMMKAYLASRGREFPERLLRALEAGRDAGGQARGMWDRSASLHVYEEEEHAMLDLRVDIHEQGIAELRRLYEHYRPLLPLYYGTRARHPESATSGLQWEWDHPPVFSVPSRETRLLPPPAAP